MELHSAVKKYKCNSCDQAFHQAKQLFNHKNRHHSNSRPYACLYCPKAFTCKDDLKKHEPLHTGDRPRICDICGKGFIQAHAFKSHRTTHFPERPFLCQVCGKAFSAKQFLKNHIKKVHEDKTPRGPDGKRLKTHACDVCDSAFTSGRNLKKHKIKYHPECAEAIEHNQKTKLEPPEIVMEILGSFDEQLVGETTVA